MSLKHYSLIQEMVDREGRVLYATDILDALQDGYVLSAYDADQDTVEMAYNLVLTCYKNNADWRVLPANMLC